MAVNQYTNVCCVCCCLSTLLLCCVVLVVLACFVFARLRWVFVLDTCIGGGCLFCLVCLCVISLVIAFVGMVRDCC